MRASPIETARARHSLADVARRTGLDLYRTAGSVTVRCPFPSHGHFDRSPSLRLHLDDGIFHCFGCGHRGDVVEWVRQTEGVGWNDAIDLLDSGRPLTNAWTNLGSVLDRRQAYSHRGTPQDLTRVLDASGPAEYPDLSRTPASRVFTALAAAWQYYSYGPLQARGVAYLAGRKIDVRVLEAHTRRDEVGHTPASAEGLVTAMLAKGFTADELVDAGLAHRRAAGPIMDFYRQRVLIPIRDEKSRICGFVGRNVGDDRWPKYKNPPRTHAYDKSVNLYQPLPPPGVPDAQVVVVEGTLDAMAIAVAAISSDQAPQFCPVTQSGRELSACQLDYVLSLHTAQPVIGFDADAPGRESSARVALSAVLRGRDAMITTLPDGSDPATWLAENGRAGLTAFVRPSALRPIADEPQPVHLRRFLTETAARDGVDLAAITAILARARARLDSEGVQRRLLHQAGWGSVHGWLRRSPPVSKSPPQARARSCPNKRP